LIVPSDFGQIDWVAVHLKALQIAEGIAYLISWAVFITT